MTTTASTLARTGRVLAAGATVAFVAAGVLAGTLSGQSLWTHQDEGRGSLELEMLRPNFADEQIDFTGATAAAFLTARLRINDAWGVVADLPFARAAWDVTESAGSSRLFGNPYVGAEWRYSPRLSAEAGARLPVGDLEDIEAVAAMLVGIAGELERMEAFVPETLGLYAAASYRHPLSPQLALRLRGGGAFLTGDGASDDLLLGYTGQMWYGDGPLNVGAGLTGRANVTTDDEDADRTAHQVIVAGDYRFGQLRPGVQVRVPLDKDVREVSDFTVGISLGYTFR